MTYDVIAILHHMPDQHAVLAGMHAAGGDLRVNEIADRGILQLCDDNGAPLISIEVPVLIQVPGEVERLLGIPEPILPIWWIEARATPGDRAAELARRFAAELAQRLGGTVWTSDDQPLTAPLTTMTDPGDRS